MTGPAVAPAFRTAQPQLILFLAAGRSSYLSGQTIFLDGGVTAA